MTKTPSVRQYAKFSSYKRFLQTGNDVITTLTSIWNSGEANYWTFWKGKPDLLLLLCSKFSYMSYRSQVINVYCKPEMTSSQLYHERRIRWSREVPWVFWKPRLAVTFSSISYRSGVMSVYIPTGNDVITISVIRVCPMDMELADSEPPCPICCKWSVINISLISYRLGVIQCFIFKGEFALWSEKSRFSSSHALKFDLVSTRPPKGMSLRQTLVLSQHTPSCAWVRESW